MNTQVLFAKVILALHLPYFYTYRVPTILIGKVKIGQRVAVQLRQKIYSAIIIDLTNELNDDKTEKNLPISPKLQLKFVLDIIDEQPIVTKRQIEFFKWVSDYYIAYIGDVLTVAMPASFRLKSETIINISPYFNSDISDLEDKEVRIINFVMGKDKVTLEDIKTMLISEDLTLTQAFVLKTINKLIETNVLITDEELYSKYTPKKEIYITLNDIYTSQQELKKLFDKLDKDKRTRPQCEVILKYLALTKTKRIIKKSELEEKDCSSSTIATLLKKEIFIKQSHEISRLKCNMKTDDASSIRLSKEQQQCFDKIIAHWNDIPISLIHGVTGSGKTEVYIKLIDRVINHTKNDDNKLNQVLYLLPEIAITTQLIKRLEKYFGNQVVVYNSKFSMVERAEIWQRTITDEGNNKFQIILGSRSSVFLPFTNLKLVIIDEEHDTSYKQTEPVPHYNGRDCALYIAKMFNAKAILGSATPNVESYKMADEGKYQLLELNKQYFDLPLPKIEFVDMQHELKENNMHGIFSQRLYEEINSALNDKKQVIIFQNRRGYAPHIECNVCGFVPHCPNCDVALVLHKEEQDLECHYCGYHTDVLSYCPQCQSHSIRWVGIGTEKIEEELQIYFPNAKIKRMDSDSMRTKDAYTNIINDFALHNIDILCGTQIISKGLDFENVSLVGVLGADAMLHYPDFRAFERAFQILTQVSGRAGRKGQQGKVLIQTFEPENPIMLNIMQRNYKRMYREQLRERQILNFPPFCKMIKLTLQHKNREFLRQKSMEYALHLRKIFGGRLFGPQEPIIARIKNLYAMEIWLKIEKNISYTVAKQCLRQYNEEFLIQKTNMQIRISIDVDPV